MTSTKACISLFIFFLISFNGFILLLILFIDNNNNINISFADSSSTNSSSILAKSKNHFIKIGQGNSTVSYNQYYPPYIEIAKGDSITWYNGMDIPLAHTVTFQSLDNMEKIAVPFYVPNDTKFVPAIENTGEPFKETSENGTQTVMVLNSRALNPTIITNDSKVLNLGMDAKYVFEGNEKFVNSGPLLSLDENQNFDYPFSKYFTLVFDKPGLYEYSCLFHPWMVGKILVKPK